MKKVLFVAFASALVFSCSGEKGSAYDQDSNIMLEEPKAEEVKKDSTAQPAAAPAVATDSTATAQ